MAVTHADQPRRTSRARTGDTNGEGCLTRRGTGHGVHAEERAPQVMGVAQTDRQVRQWTEDAGP